MRRSNYSIFKFFLLFLLFSAFTPIFSEESIKTIKVGFYENAPKLYKDKNGKISGFHIDIIEAIAKNENWHLEYVEGSWDSGLDNLKNGKIDLFLDVAYSTERAKEYLFNNETVLLNWAVIYIKNGSTANSLLDLANKKIATMKGSIHTTGEFGIVKLLESFNIKSQLVLADDYTECLKLLDTNKVDAAVVNRLFGLQNRGSYDVRATSIMFNPSHIRYAFPKDRELSFYLIERIDSNLKLFQQTKNDPVTKAFNKYLLKNITKEKRTQINLKMAVLISLVILFLVASLLFLIFSTSNRSTNYFRYIATNPAMNQIRTKILDTSLIVFAIFSIPMSLSMIYQGFVISWDNHLFLIMFCSIVLIVTVIFLGKIHLNLKLVILIAILFLNGLLILKLWGRIGIGSIFFLASSLITSVMYGKRGGILVLILGFVITITFGLLISFGIVATNYRLTDYSQTLSSWFFTLFIVFVIFLTLISGIERFYAILIDSVENLDKNVKIRTNELEVINQRLTNEINEKIKIEKELINAKIKAEEASRTKSSFLANITHEIRTPLNAILGYSQLLRFQEDIKDEYKNQIETIINSGEHLLELINEILEMSKIEAGVTEIEFDSFDFHKILNDVCKIFKIKADKKRLDFKLEIASSVPKVIFSDRTKIRQVVINLVGNAFKFTKDGHIWVNVKTLTIEDKNLIIVDISDTGTGISSADIERIFKPFEQTHIGRMSGGTGLGLSISKKIAKILNGDIYVKSSLGEGSLFSFSFQYELGDISKIEKDVLFKNVIKIKNNIKLKVLVVDDRDSNRDILVKMLIPLGFETKEAENGLKALEYVKSWTPDILLLDILMPEMDGIEVIKILKEDKKTKDIKIIVITASVLDEDIKNIMSLGANSFIRKPFKQPEVLEEIKKLLNIEYIYEDVKIVNDQNNDQITDTQLIALFNNLPKEFISKFREKLVIGDISDINKLNDLIANYDKKVYNYFEELIDNFDFNIIISILNRIGRL